jgi:hypothetical protein
VVTSGSQSGLPVNNLLLVQFTTGAKGSLDVTVDWTIASDSIHLYVSANICTVDQINNSTCTYLIESPPSPVKPRVVTVNNVAAGNYTLYIGNRGPATESVSWQIGLTTGGTVGTTATTQAVGTPGPIHWERFLRP